MKAQLHRIQCCAMKVLSDPTPDLTTEEIKEMVKKARKEEGHDNVHRQFTTILTHTFGEKPVENQLKKLGFKEMKAEGDLGDLRLWLLDIQKIHPLSNRGYY